MAALRQFTKSDLLPNGQKTTENSGFRTQMLNFG